MSQILEQVPISNMLDHISQNTIEVEYPSEPAMLVVTEDARGAVVNDGKFAIRNWLASPVKFELGQVEENENWSVAAQDGSNDHSVSPPRPSRRQVMYENQRNGDLPCGYYAQDELYVEDVAMIKRVSMMSNRSFCVWPNDDLGQAEIDDAFDTIPRIPGQRLEVLASTVMHASEETEEDVEIICTLQVSEFVYLLEVGGECRLKVQRSDGQSGWVSWEMDYPTGKIRFFAIRARDI